MLGNPIEERSVASAKGSELERRFAILLLEHGYDVRKPSGYTTWDLEVVTPGRILRVQVKSGFLRTDRWWHSLQKSNSTNGTRRNQAYAQNDFDYLAFDGPDNDLYIVPIAELRVNPRAQMSLIRTLTNMHVLYSKYRVNGNN